MSLAYTTTSAGVGADAAVEKDHTGPAAAPDALRATICQKYIVLGVSWLVRYEFAG